MAIRCVRERVLQTLCFETGGLLLATPVYQAAFGASAVGSATLMTALALAVALWSPLHNAAFDMAELRLAGRVASDRPHGLRVIHALSQEVTGMVLTLPLVVTLGGHGILEALAVEAALTLFYAAYAYAFHLAYDRLRPVRPTRADAAALRDVIGPVG
jgi:uncharacterized membrane protein